MSKREAFLSLKINLGGQSLDETWMLLLAIFVAVFIFYLLGLTWFLIILAGFFFVAIANAQTNAKRRRRTKRRHRRKRVRKRRRAR